MFWSHLLTFHEKYIEVWTSILFSLSHININNSAHLLHSIPSFPRNIFCLKNPKDIERRERHKVSIHTSYRISISKWTHMETPVVFMHYELISDQQNQQQPKYKFNMSPLSVCVSVWLVKITFNWINPISFAFFFGILICEFFKCIESETGFHMDKNNFVGHIRDSYKNIIKINWLWFVRCPFWFKYLV